MNNDLKKAKYDYYMEKSSGTTVDARLVWKTVHEITSKSAVTRQFNFQAPGLSAADVANLFNDPFAAVRSHNPT